MKKKLFRFSFIVGVLMLILIVICNQKISHEAKGKTFTSVDEIPYHKVGLLLGTSKFTKHHWINLFYKYRIDATVSLMNAGKIKYVVVSGDNHIEEYNEPEMMRADLITQGIDSTKIFLDYAGFRTFDSVKRLKEIFGQKDMTIISQQFHNERALFIAKNENMDAVAFNAKDVSKRVGIKTMLREKLARVKVYLDYVFHVKPHFLGEKIEIPA